MAAASTLAHSVLVVAASTLCATAAAETPLPVPSASPSTRAQENAAIVDPLVEIGRVRARTPYCGALARAREGIDSAIAYEYALPVIAGDLKHFRLDSGLTKDRSLRKAERDLRALWDLAVGGRADVQALRGAANAAGLDSDKKKEMLAFANALDGAKARQMNLAKSIAKVLGTVAEQPVRSLVDSPADDQGRGALRPGGKRFMVPTVTPTPGGQIKTYTDTMADAVAGQERMNQLFGAFALEEFIRDDLRVAAQHGSAAMKLGDCAG